MIKLLVIFLFMLTASADEYKYVENYDMGTHQVAAKPIREFICLVEDEDNEGEFIEESGDCSNESNI